MVVLSISYVGINYFDDYEGNAMNILVLSIGVLLMAMSAVHCRAVKRTLSDINHWVRNEDGENLTAYGIMSFALVVFVVWGISLL